MVVFKTSKFPDHHCFQDYTCFDKQKIPSQTIKIVQQTDF